MDRVNFAQLNWELKCHITLACFMAFIFEVPLWRGLFMSRIVELDLEIYENTFLIWNCINKRDLAEVESYSRRAHINNPLPVPLCFKQNIFLN